VSTAEANRAEQGHDGGALGMQWAELERGNPMKELIRIYTSLWLLSIQAMSDLSKHEMNQLKNLETQTCTFKVHEP